MFGTNKVLVIFGGNHENKSDFRRHVYQKLFEKQLISEKNTPFAPPQLVFDIIVIWGKIYTHRKGCPIFIQSTVAPHSTLKLNEKFAKKIDVS